MHHHRRGGQGRTSPRAHARGSRGGSGSGRVGGRTSELMRGGRGGRGERRRAGGPSVEGHETSE